MGSTMHKNWVNNLMVLQMCKEEIGKVDIRTLANEVTRKNSRKERFVITSFVISGMIRF